MLVKVMLINWQCDQLSVLVLLKYHNGICPSELFVESSVKCHPLQHIISSVTWLFIQKLIQAMSWRHILLILLTFPLWATEKIPWKLGQFYGCLCSLRHRDISRHDISSVRPSDTMWHPGAWSSLIQAVPVRCQATTWTNDDLLSIRASGTYYNEISFKEMYLKMSSAT